MTNYKNKYLKYKLEYLNQKGGMYKCANYGEFGNSSTDEYMYKSCTITDFINKENEEKKRLNKQKAKNKFLKNLYKKKTSKNIELNQILNNVLRKMNFSHIRRNPKRIKRTLSGKEGCEKKYGDLLMGVRFLDDYADKYLLKNYAKKYSEKYNLLKSQNFRNIISEYLVSKISNVGFCGTAVLKTII